MQNVTQVIQDVGVEKGTLLEQVSSTLLVKPWLCPFLMSNKTVSRKTRFIVMDLPIPPASASADSTCIRVKELNNFFKAELSSGYFYTLQ